MGVEQRGDNGSPVRRLTHNGLVMALQPHQRLLRADRVVRLHILCLQRLRWTVVINVPKRYHVTSVEFSAVALEKEENFEKIIRMKQAETNAINGDAPLFSRLSRSVTW